jgi:hypothetical protein
MKYKSSNTVKTRRKEAMTFLRAKLQHHADG